MRSKPRWHYFQQPRQRKHQRLQAGSCDFRRPALSECFVSQVRSPHRTHVAFGSSGGNGYACCRNRAAVHTGQPRANRQCPRYRYSGPRLSRGPYAGRLEAFTRDGSMHLNDQGILVTSAGYQLQPPVTIPQDALSITVAPDGTVSVQQPGSPQATQVGLIQITDFVNPAGLEARGENLYLETGSSGTPLPGNRDSTVWARSSKVLWRAQTSMLLRKWST